MEINDRIFYVKGNNFYVDTIKDIVVIDGKTLYELTDYNWWTVTEDEVIDESDERVKDYMCLEKDAMVKLSDVRDWLDGNAYNYYESDEWSNFDRDKMIKDLCKFLLYEKS